MSHPYFHAKSSAKNFGGEPAVYLPIHDFMDASKSTYAHWRHRAILHNSFGIYLAEKVFGPVVTLASGKKVPVRVIAEQHVIEDMGRIPTVEDWLRNLNHQDWMTKGVQQIDDDEKRTSARIVTTKINCATEGVENEN